MAALADPGVKDTRALVDQRQLLSHRNLLQELLLALLGHAGDVFIDLGGGEARSAPHTPPAHPQLCTLVLSPDLAWVDAPDRALINELVSLGFHYRAVRAFVATERASIVVTPSSHGVERPRGSIYRQALAAGLMEALDVYHEAILALQLEVMDPAAATMVLSSLRHKLHDHAVVLPQLHRLVHVVATGGEGGDGGPLAGAAVLRLLADTARAGLPALQSTLQRLAWHAGQALHKQLAAWLVYGQVLDPHGQEFFIVRTAQGDGAEVVSWAHGHELIPDRLPPGVGPDTADALLFVGKGVALLRNPPPSAAAALGGAPQLFPPADVAAAAAALRQLADAPGGAFEAAALDATVRALRAKVAALLWHLVVERADLLSVLAACKSYFLLAKGEFAHAFLAEAAPLLALPPRPASADADIAAPWAAAAAKSSAQHDALFPRFRLRWGGGGETLPAGYEVPAFEPGWDGLWLEAALDWPLAGLLLTRPALARYNALFQLLLRLRRVAGGLDRAWGILCAARKEADGRGGPGALGSWRAEARQGPRPAQLLLIDRLLRLRAAMAHVVTNLQVYIQTDVIESAHSVLEARISGARDFAELERAHAAYLHTLASQCFLTTHTMARTISAVFRLVADLCALVDDVALRDSPASTTSGAILVRRADDLAAAFSQRSAELFTVLHSSRLLDANKAPYLRQLFLRLNFNDHMRASLAARPPAIGAGHARPSGLT